MIGGHPGGLALTERLLALAGRDVGEGQRILDLGAGQGESVAWLNQRGYEAMGIDLQPQNLLVKQQDMRKLSFPGESFHLCLAECSMSGCGDGREALSEAFRVLRPGGSLLLSDVFFHREACPCLSFPEPLTWETWQKQFVRAEFTIRKMVDETSLWKEFFLESLWNGNADENCIGFFKQAGKYQCGYFLAWLGKEEGADGFI